MSARFYTEVPVEGSDIKRRVPTLTGFLCAGVTLLCLYGILGAPAAGATEWSTLSNIDPATDSDARYPIPAITPDGTQWMFWTRKDLDGPDQEVYYSRWNGQSWDEPQTVNPPNATDDRIPRVACALDGALWVLWTAPRTDGSDNYVGLASRWSGTAWTLPDTVWVDGTRYNNYDLYAISATESYFIREGASGDILVYYHTGASQESTRFDLPSAAGYQPTIAVDADGVVWAAWTHQEAPMPERLEFSRLLPGGWTQPEIIPLPVETKLPRLSIDKDDGKWLICAGDDPANTYWGDDIWAIRWNGLSWDSPTRISDAIQSNDSLQVWNAVSRTPGENPRVVWVRAHVHFVTRYDVLTTAWDGESWSPPEVVGALKDSTYVNWPDVAVRGVSAWVAWMAEPKSPPYVFNAIATHAIPATTAAFSADFEAATTQSGVRMSWVIQPIREVINLRIHRISGAVPDPAAPPGAAIIYEASLPLSHASTTVDRSLPSGGLYTYWLELSLQDGRVLWIGPQTALYSPRPRRGRLVAAAPNPSGGGVLLRGTRGTDRPTHVNIYNVEGRLVCSLRITGATTIEDFSLTWDGRGSGGGAQSNGVYFARLVTADQPAEGPGVKLVLLR